MDMTVSMFVKKAIPKLWILALCLLIGFAGSYIYTRNMNISYSANTSVVSLNINVFEADDINITSEINTARRIANEFLEILKSDRVAENAAARLSEEYGITLNPRYISAMVSAAAVTNSNVINFTASAGDPALVVPVANATRDAFIYVVNSLTSQSYFNVLDEASYDRIATIYPSKTIYYIVGLAAGALLGLVALYLYVTLSKKIRLVDDFMHDHDVKSVIVIPMHNIK